MWLIIRALSLRIYTTVTTCWEPVIAEEIRAQYDLETLWALGPEWDRANMAYSEEDQEQILGITAAGKKQRQNEWAFFE